MNHHDVTLSLLLSIDSSLKLTCRHLKMDGWNMIVSFWDGLLGGAMLVSGRVTITLIQKYTPTSEK